MIKISLFIFFCTLNSVISGQNLVVNPGFEKNTLCQGIITGKFSPPAWYSANDGSPDYFSRSFNNSVTSMNYHVPENFAGALLPDSGNSYAGFIAYTSEIYDFKEYLGGTLAQTLEAGKMYHFSMRIALSDRSAYGIEQIGIYFSPDSLHHKGTTTFSVKPQLINSHSINLTKSGGWLDYESDYTASGGENYFIIGNFFPVNQLNIIDSKKRNSVPYAYYYIDNVSLIPSDKEKINPVVKDTLGITAGKKLVLNNVYFDVDKSILKEESFPILDEIIAEMKKQPNLKVEIDGHTDSDGNKDHNLQLSKERAASVAAYFISKGIDVSRISTNGFGSSKPISEEKNKNRRVEFTFSE